MHKELSAALDAISAFARPPLDAEQYRAYIARTTIADALERWGFERRFHSEYELVKEQAEAYRATSRLLRGNGAVVALLGVRGTGKTSIAARIAQDTAWKNHESSIREAGAAVLSGTVIYRKAARLVSRYKPLFADFGSTDTDRLQASLDFLCREHEVLVIDELHDCDDLKAHRRVITDIVDRRYSMLRDTILISNQTAADFMGTTSDSIISRLKEHGAIIECTWESFR